MIVMQVAATARKSDRFPVDVGSLNTPESMFNETEKFLWITTWD